MNKLKAIIKRKPLVFLLVSFAYLLLTGFLKWQMHATFGSVMFLAGGIMGIYFLDIADVVTGITPSPFRSVIFLAGFLIVSLFIITSSESMLASGLVLSLFLTILLWQIGEWQINNNVNDWYRMIASPVTRVVQQWIFAGTIAVFLLETFLFIR
jgi:hypothetical protein